MRKQFTLIELMIVIAIIAIIAAIAIPNLLEARKSGNEASALGSLKAIATSETIYREKNPEFASLVELGSAKLVDATLAAGTKSGYLVGANKDTDGGPPSVDAAPEYLWAAVATPVVRGNTGDRTFWTTQTGVIYFTVAASYLGNGEDIAWPQFVNEVNAGTKNDAAFHQKAWAEDGFGSALGK